MAPQRNAALWQKRLWAIAAKSKLFDHLVGAGEERGQQREAKRRCRLEIDDEREFGGLLDRQVGGLLALKNPASINAG